MHKNPIAAGFTAKVAYFISEGYRNRLGMIIRA
jgi:hypothetical protein